MVQNKKIYIERERDRERERTLCEISDPIRKSNIRVTGIPEGEEGEMATESLLK